MPGANAAIYYQHEAFTTELPKLMGRNAAGAAFLTGFARHADVDHFVGYTRTPKDFDQFRATVTKRGAIPVERVAHGDLAGLARAQTLFVYSPGLADFCWERAHAGASAYSVVGLTHTISSDRVMEDFGRFLTAPVEPWDALICTSQSVKRTVEGVLERWGAWLGERLGAPPPHPRLKLPVIPLGVDCDAFEPNEDLRAGFRGRHGIAAGETAFMFLGRLSFHAKAHPLPMYLALEAAAKRTQKPVTLILAGYFFNEAIQRSFQDGAKRFCPSVRIVQVDGRKPAERAGAWAAADVFTSFSDNIQESFGLAPLEAMAAGLPAVVSDWDGYRDTVTDGETGIMVPTAMPEPGQGLEIARRYLTEVDNYDLYIGHVSQCTAVDVEAATAAYVRLIEDPALGRRLGEAGRNRARERFDWSVVVRAYQDLWQELAEVRRGASSSPSSVYPLRDDPFRVFSAFPTFAIGSGTRIETLAADPAREARRIAESSMSSFSLPWMLPKDDFGRLLGLLQQSRDHAVAELEAHFPPARRAALIRSLGWLAKGNIVRLRER
jgi:glycosyltransferase involved in cell wall biosynthesis